MKVGLFIALIKTAILIDDDYYRRKIVSSTGYEDPATAMDSLIDNPRNPNRPALPEHELPHLSQPEVCVQDFQVAVNRNAPSSSWRHLRRKISKNSLLDALIIQSKRLLSMIS